MKGKTSRMLRANHKISLPLSIEDALRAAMQIKPPAETRPKKKKAKKRSAKKK